MTNLPSATLSVDVETPSGWRLKIVSLPGGAFHAQLTGPDTTGYELFRWPSIERVYESLEGHFRDVVRLPHVWTTLRAQVEAEIHS